MKPVSKAYVVIPTYNERENIGRLIERVVMLYPDLRILVVDDNSPDGTGDLVRELAATHATLTLKSRAGKLGLASAYLEAIAHILETEPDTEAIITMDSDFSHDPYVIGTMLAAADRADLVIGSRYVPGGQLENWPASRVLLSKAGNAYATFASGTDIRDLTAGFQCFRTSLLRHPAFQNVAATGFAFQMEMKLIAHHVGARIVEVPITFKNRENGYSKISSGLHRYIYEGLLMPIKLRLRYSKLRP